MSRIPGVVLAATLVASSALTQSRRENPLVRLWSQETPAFGVFVPNESPTPREATLYTREGGEKLAMTPLYDFVFLNLEVTYDVNAVKAIAEGLRSPKSVGRKALLVRIPPIHADGPAVAKARVKEALDLGADTEAHSLIGAALLRAEWSDDAKLVRRRCLVLRAAKK